MDFSGACYFVDAMSSFGGVAFSMRECCADFMVSSSNKCLQGAPGFSYVICNTEKLLAAKGNNNVPVNFEPF